MFFQYTECMGPLHKLAGLVKCIYSGWSTDHEASHTFAGHVEPGPGKRLTVQKWFELEPFHSIKGTVDVTCSNPNIELFTKWLHWPQQQFCDNMFSKSGF